MGQGRWKKEEYEVQAKEAQASSNSGFEAKKMDDEFNPISVTMRYSRRGPFNEFRLPITVCIGLDVTGSMGDIPRSLLTGKLGSLMDDLKQTFNRPNENLQISFAGIGDVITDTAPLQVTHFESDNRFAQQLQRIYLEAGGGGNGGESYNALWWYAANKTELNYVKRDKRKGILITIGDDHVHKELSGGHIQMWLDSGYKAEGAISNAILLKAAREQYHVYHIVVVDGSSYSPEVLRSWNDLLGKEFVVRSKSTAVADAIATIIKNHRPELKADAVHFNEMEWIEHNKRTLSDEQWQEVLQYALCPVSRTFMEYPVTWGVSKRACEKDAVVAHVEKFGKDPITHKEVKLSDLKLKLNEHIAQLCENYRKYFFELPADRRAHLINALYPDKREENKMSNDKKLEISKGPSDNSQLNANAFFAEKEALQLQIVALQRQVENLQGTVICPITQDIMERPVMLEESKQTYDEKAIIAWLDKNGTDPITGQKIANRKLIHNAVLQTQCDDARRAQANKAQTNVAGPSKP